MKPFRRSWGVNETASSAPWSEGIEVTPGWWSGTTSEGLGPTVGAETSGQGPVGTSVPGCPEDASGATVVTSRLSSVTPRESYLVLTRPTTPSVIHVRESHCDHRRVNLYDHRKPGVTDTLTNVFLLGPLV